jgi:hypothetical protein
MHGSHTKAPREGERHASGEIGLLAGTWIAIRGLPVIIQAFRVCELSDASRCDIAEKKKKKDKDGEKKKKKKKKEGSQEGKPTHLTCPGHGHVFFLSFFFGTRP